MAVASSDVVQDETGNKLLHRKLRNRASAAISRERKRRYVQNLEEKVEELEDLVRKLEVENATLMESHFIGLLFGGKGLDDASVLDFFFHTQQ